MPKDSAVVQGPAPVSASPAQWLRRPEAIRSRCSAVLAAGTHGELKHFEVNEDALPVCARFVAETILSAYPDLDVPNHSRWRQFDAGGVARAPLILSDHAVAAPSRQAHAATALTILSVLLDAGAGYGWRYREVETGHRYERSEGIAVATLRMFDAGLFSTDPKQPHRLDAEPLMALTGVQLAAALQITPDNPLVGFQGRLELLHLLGAVLAARTDVFGTDRPEAGNLLTLLCGLSREGRLAAADALDAVLEVFAPVWAGGATLDGIPLGDVWRHQSAGGAGPTAGLVPLHALGQWLVYSLDRPLAAAGIALSDTAALTARAEHRNGGLLVDTGVLSPKHPAVAIGIHRLGSDVAIEWRALTVALMDPLADLVRQELRVDEGTLSFSALLEGGTARAGRILAAARREDGGPPIRVANDGVIF